MNEHPQHTSFTKLTLWFHTLSAYVLEHKRTVLITTVCCIFLLLGTLFLVYRSTNQTIKHDQIAIDLVHQLQAPHLGKKEPTLPGYPEIEKTLTQSSHLAERYNGILLQEAIIANQTESAIRTFKNDSRLFPMQSWPWKEMAPLANLLEAKNYEKALNSVQALLKSIQQKKDEPLFCELVGYLRMMEGRLLQTLGKPESESSVQFENWKKRYPEESRKLIALFAQ